MIMAHSFLFWKRLPGSNQTTIISIQPGMSYIFLQPAFQSFEVAKGLWLALNLGMFYMSLEWIRYTLDWDLAGWRLWLTSTPVNNCAAGF